MCICVCVEKMFRRMWCWHAAKSGLMPVPIAVDLFIWPFGFSFCVHLIDSFIFKICVDVVGWEGTIDDFLI